MLERRTKKCVIDQVAKTAELFLSNTALQIESNGPELSYGELIRKVKNLAVHVNGAIQQNIVEGAH